MTGTGNVMGEAMRLLRPFWPIAVFATAMGTASGLATAWLLATINKAFHADDVTSALLWTFAGLVMLTLIGEIASDLGNSWIGQRIVASLRKDLVAKIICAPIDRIERYRAHRLITSLTADVETISAFTFSFSSIAIAFSVTAGCIIYLLFLSPALFGIVAVAIAIGIAVNRIARNRGGRHFETARAAQDDLQKHYRAITDGAKELRINRERRRRVHRVQIDSTIDKVRDLKVAAMRVFMTANACDAALFFAVVGLIIGLQGAFGVERTVVSGFVLVLLYLKGPLDQVVGAYGAFANAQVSFRHVAQLSAAFESPEPHLLSAEPLPPAMAIESIRLENVTYAFPVSDGAEPFVLGPIDLTVRGGEILFVVGENGSGKTTLIKLILGLYAPQGGAILLNGKPVGAEDRDAYRQCFSAVLFDYFLFDDLMPSGTGQGAIQSWLERLGMAHKVAVRDGVFSTTDLSAGQRKRLALIQACLEGRSVIVFDEWAAEQNPAFRRLFYQEMLPELKRQGKTLIVISHDDRYFGAADRLLVLENGRLAAADGRPKRFRESEDERHDTQHG